MGQVEIAALDAPKEVHELGNRQTGVPNDSSERTGWQFSMSRDRDREYGPWLGQNHVASRLALKDPVSLLQGATCLVAAYNWQPGHDYAATSIMTVSTTTGRPRSFRTARHNSMASLTFVRASSLVAPSLPQPGIAGTSAIQ
jgi:hypothetical protein